MSDRDAFLRAIADSPADDAPRLVFADWLDEHGEPDYADFIRTQCAVERLDEADEARIDGEARCHELLERHGTAWLGDTLPEGVRVLAFRRGALEAVTATLTAFSTHGPDVRARHPIRRVRVLNSPGAFDFRTSEVFRGIAELDLRDLNHVGDLLESSSLAGLRLLTVGSNASPIFLAQSPALPTLTTLDISDSRPPHGNIRSAFPAIENAPLSELHATGLRLNGHDIRDLFGPDGRLALTTLDLSHNSLPYGSLTVLAQSPRLVGLRRLGLAGGVNFAYRLAALQTAPWLPHLRRLNLCGCRLEARDLGVLAPPHGPTALASLHLGDNLLRDDAPALLDNDVFRRLTFLELSGTRLTDMGLARLFVGPWPVLRELRLNDNRHWLGSMGVGFLARANLPRLETLSLSNCDVGDVGVQSLAESRGLPRLRRLEIANVGLTAGGVRAMVGSPAFVQRLRYLDVTGNPALEGDGLMPLAESPDLSPRLELRCVSTRMSEAVTRTLVHRLGRVSV